MAAPAFGQSLADAALKQEEVRKAVNAPARTYTKADLKDSPGDVLPLPGATTLVAAADGTLFDFSPARYRDGAVPALPVLPISGGQVLLELTVGRDGRVTTVKPLRTTAPFTDLLVDAVGRWSFFPAEKRVRPKPGEDAVPKPPEPVESTVLVAGQFRAPALMNTGTVGELPKAVASASAEAPLALTTIEPSHVISALSPGLVFVQTKIDQRGAVTDANVLQSAPPYDDVAQAAAREWKFLPARVDGLSVEAFAYIVFGFPLPVFVSPDGGPPTTLPLPGGSPPSASSTSTSNP